MIVTIETDIDDILLGLQYLNRSAFMEIKENDYKNLLSIGLIFFTINLMW